VHKKKEKGQEANVSNNALAIEHVINEMMTTALFLTVKL
jgi:hypothetical protein